MLLVSEIVILALIAGPILTIVALIDLLRRPTSEWTATGQDRLVWALVVILVAFVGPVIYLTLGRSKLNEAQVNSVAPIVAS